MSRAGVADIRNRYRIKVHAFLAFGLVLFNLALFGLADLARLNDHSVFTVVMLILFLGVIVAGYGINLVEDHCRKPRPIHCSYCRTALPIASEWRCGYCQAKNSGSPLEKCKKCGCHPRAIHCPKAGCEHAVLLRAPLGKDPKAVYVNVEQSEDKHKEELEHHRRQQEIIERNKELAEAEANLLKAQEKAARAQQALARAKETPEQTYEREVLVQLHSEGKRREVMKKLRDEIQKEMDEDERNWKAAVLDRIERESLEL